MNLTSFRSSAGRRSFLMRLAASVGILGAYLSPTAEGSLPATDASWRPARHAQDDWLDKIPGIHRMVFDATTSGGLSSSFHFAPVYFTANNNSYGVKDQELAVLIVARHKAASFGFNDAMWAKYGKYFAQHAEFGDSQTKEPPKVNPYDEPISALTERGVHFAVCEMSTKAIAAAITAGTNSESAAVLKELSANLIANGRLVPAGIVALNRAQERGYSVVAAGA